MPAGSTAVARILSVPLIDLDHRPEAASGRAPRQRLRVLIPLTTGLLLFSVAGEKPRESLSPHDRMTFCPLAALAGGTAGTSVSILDGDTGKVLRIIHCPAG